MHRTCLCLLGWGLLLAGLGTGAPERCTAAPEPVLAATYSIVAYDSEAKEWGVGTASRALAVGAMVPWAKAGVGAIATQSVVNVTFGSRGLELLAEGKSAEEVLKTVTEADPQRDYRQLAIVDAKGGIAHFTGKKCTSWAGGRQGKSFVCVGNLLTGEAVLDEAAKAFEAAKGPMPWKLVAALEAGEKAGGDKHGKQAAAILVVHEHGGPNGFGDRLVDLRVDDHETPVQELARILAKQVRRPRQD